ncbi:Innexin unc-7, partial [Taenia solium]
DNEFSTLEDFGDRLNSFYTTVILLILVSITMTNVYFLRPISCTAPSAPPSGFGSYAESAILFYVPHLIWQALSVFTLGDNLNYLITCAQTATTSDDLATRSKLVQVCAHHLHLLSRQHTDTRQSKLSRFQRKALASTLCASLCVFGKRLGNRTAVLYLFVKFLYVVNCLGQLFIVMRFLGPDNASQSCLLAFSKRLFNFASRRQEWGGSDLFPLQTLCPIRVPNLGVRAQLYTAICALPVNMLNEKIYLFLWVWIIAALLVSIITAGLWMLRLLSRSWGEAFLRSFLETSLLTSSPHPDREGQGDLHVLQVANSREKQLKAFLKRAVGCDGNFLIRMLRLNAGDVIAEHEGEGGAEDERRSQPFCYGMGFYSTFRSLLVPNRLSMCRLTTCANFGRPASWYPVERRHVIRRLRRFAFSNVSDVEVPTGWKARN